MEQLLTDGFSYVFGNPGTSEEGFLDALSAYPELLLVFGHKKQIQRKNDCW
jgi:benzoylformate decarboxylase